MVRSVRKRVVGLSEGGWQYCTQGYKQYITSVTHDKIIQIYIESFVRSLNWVVVSLSRPAHKKFVD